MIAGTVGEDDGNVTTKRTRNGDWVLNTSWNALNWRITSEDRIGTHSARNRT